MSRIASAIQRARSWPVPGRMAFTGPDGRGPGSTIGAGSEGGTNWSGGTWMRSAAAGGAGATSACSMRTVYSVDLRPRPDANWWPSTSLAPVGVSRLTERARPDGPAWATWAPVMPAAPKPAPRSERAIFTVQGSGSLVVYGAAFRYGMLGEPAPNPSAGVAEKPPALAEYNVDARPPP